MPLRPEPAVPQCGMGDINRDLVFFSEHLHPAYVIGMFMRYKDRFYLMHTERKPFHAFFYFIAGNACIYENGFGIVTNVIAVAITPRI